MQEPWYTQPTISILKIIYQCGETTKNNYKVSSLLIELCTFEQISEPLEKCYSVVTIILQRTFFLISCKKLAGINNVTKYSL